MESNTVQFLPTSIENAEFKNKILQVKDLSVGEYTVTKYDPRYNKNGLYYIITILDKDSTEIKLFSNKYLCDCIKSYNPTEKFTFIVKEVTFKSGKVGNIIEVSKISKEVILK